MRLVLASTSPRRQRTALPAQYSLRGQNSSLRGVDAAAPFRRRSRCGFCQGQSRFVATQEPQSLILASDTLIECDNVAVGKPRDVAEARSILRDLAGRAHLVKTAVSAVCRDRRFQATEISTARVWMKPFDEKVHERYLATEDSLGKAGAIPFKVSVRN
jgi:septum formation protein